MKMRVHLSGHHVEVTPALRSYVEKKLGRILRRFDRLIDVHCILTVEKLRHRAESTVKLRGSTIHAASTEEDMYAAIDALADKLEEQVRRHKEKVRDHRALEVRRHAPAAAS
jgi:putative sigma-54 modulation protein